MEVYLDNAATTKVFPEVIEIMNKISRDNQIKGLDANQFFLSMFLYSEVWKDIPIYKVKDEDIKKLLEIEKDKSYFSFVLIPIPLNPSLIKPVPVSCFRLINRA